MNEEKNEAREVYTRALTYIEKYYDYENSFFKYLNALNIIKKDLKYDDILKVASLLNIKINEDRLYDEINIIRQYVTELRNDSNCSSTEKIWVAIFNAVDNLNEIRKIVSKTMSIPISNAFVERIFSIMESVWRGDRNRMRLNLVKAELAIRINFDMTCEQFFLYLKAPEQKSLVQSAQSDKKYNFRK